MRLQISKSKGAASFYVIKTVYENGKERTVIVEKLGTEDFLRKALSGKDPYVWAKEYVEELNRKEKEDKREIIVRYATADSIPKSDRRLFNGGYLFLQRIYHELGIKKICKTISDKYKFTFDLDSVLSRLVYGRLVFPASKLATHELSKRFIEQPNFELQHIYRALEVIAKETDFIQSELYGNSLNTVKRNTGILYYDCTNYFFEIEQENGIKQYGISKEHRPNPIVQMGLFMDSDGLPLAFNINSGNTNEQITLRPLEKKILSDFKLSKFIVCTDAGLASTDNRRFNNAGNRAFVTTQSVKKLKDFLKEWALSPKGWRTAGNENVFDIAAIGDEEHSETVFYKERWIKEDGLEQKLIVTYSIKHRDYQRKIRQAQIMRAQKLIDSRPQNISKANQNDYKRLISKIAITPDGEVAETMLYQIDRAVIEKESAFDGFYGCCTNLDEDVAEIIKINNRRWEIEESFRIMKSEFKARPVYLSRDDRITAHFTTCFLSLLIFRVLEKKLKEQFTCREIIDGLREMNFLKVFGEGFVPAYTRTDLTDLLHETFAFRTDYQIITTTNMKKICKHT